MIPQLSIKKFQAFFAKHFSKGTSMWDVMVLMTIITLSYQILHFHDIEFPMAVSLLRKMLQYENR